MSNILDSSCRNKTDVIKLVKEIIQLSFNVEIGNLIIFAGYK